MYNSSKPNYMNQLTIPNLMNSLIDNLIKEEAEKYSIGITEYKMLMFLSDSIKGYSASDFIKEGNFSKAHVSGVCANLIKLGYIEYARKQKNNKTKLLSITKKGLEVINNSFSIKQKYYTIIYEGLSRDEVLLIARSNKKIQENIRVFLDLK